MNERIKQLWDDSIQEFSKQHQYATIMLPEPLREKFAELIVRECLLLCDQEHAHSIHTHAGAWNTAIKRCKDRITQHFAAEFTCNGFCGEYECRERADRCLRKAVATVNQEPVDPGELGGYENVEINMEQPELYRLMLRAHQQNITLNQLVEQILMERVGEVLGGDHE